MTTLKGVELIQNEKYMIIYYTHNFTRRTRFDGAIFLSHDEKADEFAFLTPRGHEIVVPEERFVRCVRLEDRSTA